MMAFTVYGVARPQGSMRAFVPKGGKRAIVTDGNRNVKAWRQLVAAGASAELERGGRLARALTNGPVRVIVAFHLPRPKKYARRRAVIAHITKPDIDKLSRSVLDALTGIAFPDDSCVAELRARKDYAAADAPASCEITVEPLPLYEVRA